MGFALERMMRMMMAVTMVVSIRGTEGGSLSPPAPVRFLHQAKSECHFLNGTEERVRFLDRYFYGRQEYLRFDSDRGEFEALTPLGEPDAKSWNSQKDFLEDRRRAVDYLCRHNYEQAQREQMVGRQVPPSRVSISPIQEDPCRHHCLLLCTASGFYPPGSIQFHWLKNGQEVREGVAYEEELQDGDWTYQQTALLETEEPQPGDTYACQVGHLTLETPITIQWETRRSDSARSKLWTGVVGALLGLVFGTVGLYLHLKRKKAMPIQPPAVLLS